MKALQIVKASDKRCIICGDKAYVFWPVIKGLTDFVKPLPYCNRCQKAEQIKVSKILGEFDKNAEFTREELKLKE